MGINYPLTVYRTRTEIVNKKPQKTSLLLWPKTD